MNPGERWPLGPAILGLALLFSAGPGGAAAADLSFVPAQAEINCGDELVVDVVVDGVVDLRGFSLVLEFDPVPLQLVAVEAGPLLAGAPCGHFFDWRNAAAIGDSIAFDGAGLGCSVAGPGSIARLHFEAEPVDGPSTITCRRSTLRDGLNLTIPSTCSSAEVLVTCPVPVERAGWGPWKARASARR